MVVRRFGSIIGIANDKEAEYRRLHADVWPAVAQNLRNAHVHNYSIFLRGNLLFSYLEYDGADFAADMAALAAEPETQRWRRLTDQCQMPLDDAAPTEWWAPMAEVFHLD
jgi:L-rhamnose mutarotase